MIREQLTKELIRFEKKEFPVTSVYLTLGISTGNRKSHIVELKKMIKYKKNTTYFKQLPENEQSSVLADFDRILNWFNEELDTTKALSSICFASSGSGFWKTLNLKRPLVNELVIQPKPYIRPLSTFFSIHRNYALILIDRTKAKIFESHIGEFTEQYTTENAAPEPVRGAGFQGNLERKAERNIQQTVIQHYKQVAQQVFDFNQKKNFDWIILGGKHETINEFRKYLHAYVASKIADDIEVESTAPLNEVLMKAQQTEIKAREEYEKKLLADFIAKEQKNQAVEGIQAVISKIVENWVDTLIIQEDFVHKGVFCRNDNFLSLDVTERCPIDGSSLERTNDIVEQLLHIALSQGVNVQYVKSPMDSWGKIMATLRFSITG
ncbi:MAG: hypothetical protein PHW79_10290 [Candidatus Marinimicrobia bacterium]|nr:hypothetical protein [Candidatus Neomarinimicrobiota bacterium]